MKSISGSPDSEKSSQATGSFNSEMNSDSPTTSTIISSTVQSGNISKINDNVCEEVVLDVSGKSLDFDVFEKADDSFEGLYMYKNVFSLVPRSVARLGKLKNLKFFGNEVNLFPAEFGNLVGLECLQVKVSSLELNQLGLDRMKGLKELELSKIPPRSSVLTILSEIAGLECLTKLSVCHFSIRYLPPEISCLKNLQCLDLSFNKLKNLPSELNYLKSLVSLNIANNKLVELPWGMSSLQNLKNLDLSNNRLISLECLDLDSMPNLHYLNLKHNKLDICKIPSWICCNMEGNGMMGMARHNSVASSSSSSAEMDLLGLQEDPDNHKHLIEGPPDHAVPNSASTSSCKNRYGTHKSSKSWKRHLHRVRQECPNTSWNFKGEGGHGHRKSADLHCSGSSADGSTLDVHSFEEEDEDEVCGGHPLEDEEQVPKPYKFHCKAKRHSDGVVENPKPYKFLKHRGHGSSLSAKYNKLSFCSIGDYMSDGFYDGGRDRPFLPLSAYEQLFSLDSREVILLDREKDEELDVIAFSARAMISHFRSGFGNLRRGPDLNDLQIAMLLALFVSDHFGGNDRSTTIGKMRKAVSGSNYSRPFVCTCSAGSNAESDGTIFTDLCEQALRTIKAKRNSIVVPLGCLRVGVCRHRALLLKYLCDRMVPAIPCEVVRGYLDFLPHAWNSVVISRGDTLARMVVDACHPHDIREETDPEFVSRYIPLSRAKFPIGENNVGTGCLFPSLSDCDRIEKQASSTLFRCKLGSLDAAVKVRSLEVCGASGDDGRLFECSCIGEVRILGILKHPCIVEFYGHQLSSKWILSADGNPIGRTFQSAIYMEYVHGGSLKNYMEKILKDGEKHVPVELALTIARDVASALVELHSKDIMHRDVKSENVLIDLDSEKEDGKPIVKLCDFDRAVPLCSPFHTCCIAHSGIQPPNSCVGTPRWMAPEVLLALHQHNLYGLEVDVWSYGCLLVELLTLQVPYYGVPEIQIGKLLESGKRPRLTEELEVLASTNRSSSTSSSTSSSSSSSPNNSTTTDGSEADIATLRFLVDLFYRCTEDDPADRPTAADIHHSLCLQHPSTSDQEHTREM